MLSCYLKKLTVGLATWMCCAMPAVAQTVTPTSGSGNVGTVANGTSTLTITGGTQQLRTLFHSFEDFSPETADVLFQLSSSQSAVERVITRITGSNISFIDGQLSLTGGDTPDVFLINPNGISFGENARLSLPGSFLASTASEVAFPDGGVFSAIDPQAVPLLTVSAPTGLQFANTPGSITVQGAGHGVKSSNPIFSPYAQTGSSGLAVSEGETLALIGGALTFRGGSAIAPRGRVELGSVASGSVTLKQEAQGLAASYAEVEQFSDIALLQQSLIDISGSPAGSSQLQGRNIRLTEGSLVWGQNRGSQSAAPILVNASEQVFIEGATPTVSSVSGIVTETLLSGAASNISVVTPQLIVRDGATILSRSFSAGSSGSVETTANQVAIAGYVPVAPNVFTVVGTTTSAVGEASSDAGSLTASVQALAISDGGYFGSTTLGSGRGGDVIINAKTVEVSGTTPTDIPSIITANTAGRGGDSGNVTVGTSELIVREGGLLTASSIGLGDAGSVTVQASERIEINTSSHESSNSTIASTVDFPPLSYKLLLGLSGTPSGSAGNVTLTTPVLEILGIGSSVTVLNFGQGDAGQIIIEADSVVLDDEGKIDAVTVDGSGGNIELQIEDILIARNGSRIETSANGGNGNGGNISIAAPVIVGVENSDIIANAVQGNGGNIDILTRGLFGLQFREQLTPESDITASSEFGTNGRVAIDSFGVAPDSGLAVLPKGLADSSNQITEGCAATGSNRFVVTGRGGIPASPTQAVGGDRIWSDTRDLAASEQGNPSAVGGPSAAALNAIVEATAWQISSSGQVELVTPAPAISTVRARCTS